MFALIQNIDFDLISFIDNEKFWLKAISQIINNETDNNLQNYFFYRLLEK